LKFYEGAGAERIHLRKNNTTDWATTLLGCLASSCKARLLVRILKHNYLYKTLHLILILN